MKQFVSLVILIISALSSNAQTTLVGLTSNGGPEGKGTAFSLSTSGTNFSIIKGFADWGKTPTGNLYKNDDGNFYGMTSAGGTFTYGSIFKMTPAGDIKILKQFNYSTDGGNPNGELIKGKDGYLYGGTTGGGTNGYGTIFKISVTGDYNVIRNLSYADGASIYGHLTLASDSNFYGITYRGGTNGYGTIFKLTQAGAFSVIHNLSSATEGSQCLSSLVEGKDGNLYGTTNSGGASGYGTIFKVTKAGQLTTLKSFNGSSDGYYCNSDLIQATDGNFYGTCTGGGAGSSGVIFKISSSGTYTVVKSFAYATDGSTPKGGLFQNSDGNFYGITFSGGAKSSGTIYKLTSTYVYSVIHAFDNTTEGYNSSSSFVKGDDGKLYAMAQYGGTYNWGTAFSVATNGTFKLLATFNGASLGNAPYSSFIKGKDSAYYCTTSTGGAYGYGSIVKICGGTTSVLHSFKQTEGCYPKGNLLLANDGNFYGMTSTGGTTNYGTIFKIAPNGSFSVLHNFSSTTEGGNPYGGLIQATDGFLYGMTSSGGAGNAGTIFKINLSGTFTVLKSFVSSTDGSTPNGNLIQATDGNFYGLTTTSAKLFKLTTANVFSIIHNFSSSTDGYFPYGSLIQAKDGNLYGTCSDGGANLGGSIFQMSLSGTFKNIHSLQPATEGRSPKGSLLQGADDLLYGITSTGGTYNTGTVFKISTAGTLTVLKQLNITTDGGNAYGSLIFAPINNLVANAQSVTTDEDKALAITLKGSGAPTLTYNIITAPAHGKITGSGANIKYTPNKNYNGTDQFGFNVSVGCIASDPAVVSITVKPVPDTPVLAAIGNKTITKDSTLKFTAKGSDPDAGQALSYSMINAPAGATINATTGAFKWKPTVTGTFTFKIRVTDNGTPALYDEEQITVTVTQALTLLNVNDINNQKNVKAGIFPNPSDDILNVSISGQFKNAFIRIIDLDGKIVLTKVVNDKDASTITLNIQTLSKGIYILQLQNGVYKKEFKFIKK